MQSCLCNCFSNKYRNKSLDVRKEPGDHINEEPIIALCLNCYLYSVTSLWFIPLLWLDLLVLPLYFSDKLEFIIGHILFLQILLERGLICSFSLSSSHHLETLGCMPSSWSFFWYSLPHFQENLSDSYHLPFS